MILLLLPLNGENVPDPPVPDINWEKKRMNSRAHLLNHTPYIKECPGCQAKSRDKKHRKGAYQVADDKYKNAITLDQVKLDELDKTVGLGGFKYAMVLKKLKGKYF